VRGSALSMNIKRSFDELASKILLDCQISKGKKRKEGIVRDILVGL
jgi:hypothetical protein